MKSVMRYHAKRLLESEFILYYNIVSQICDFFKSFYVNSSNFFAQNRKSSVNRIEKMKKV